VVTDKSADGRIVAFDTFANNLVEQDNNDFSDVFIHNTDTNELSGLTLGFENAADTSTFSRVSAITPDGRYVVFASNATNITADGNSGILQLYRHDRETGTNVLVSRSLTGAEGNDASFDAQISADGNTIVFRSSASNLIDGESFERSHVYVHTVQNGETVNITSQLSPFNTNSEGQFLPVAFDMTADGQYIFLRGTTPDTVLFNRFTNQSTDLESMFPVNARNFGISDDARYLTYEDPSQEIFWVDLLTGITESVSRGILPSGRPAISSNGQYVAFEARRTVGTFMSLPGEVYVRDIFAAQTTLVTQGFDGSAANNLSPLLDVAFTGNNLVFRSSGSNLVEGDDNGKIDAFIYRIE